MGETMSKRLKFHLSGEAEMEERAFTNPFPDYEAAASAVLAAGAAEETGCARPPPTTDELGLPFHNDGKVSRQRALARPWAAPGEGGAGDGSVHPPRPHGALTSPLRARRPEAQPGRAAEWGGMASRGSVVGFCFGTNLPFDRRLLAFSAFEIH